MRSWFCSKNLWLNLSSAVYLWVLLSISFTIIDMPPLVICVEKTCPNHHGRYLDFVFFRFLRFCKIARHEVFACTLFLIHVITKFHPSQFQIKRFAHSIVLNLGITRFAHSMYSIPRHCSFTKMWQASKTIFLNEISRIKILSVVLIKFECFSNCGQNSVKLQGGAYWKK